MDHWRNQRGNQKIPGDKWQWKHNDPKPMGHSSEREVYSNTILPQEQEKCQVNNLTLHLKQLEKEEQTKPKVSRMKEIIKIRAEINRNKENNSKDQWNQKLVLWEDKQNWQTISQTHQEKEGEDSNQ